MGDSQQDIDALLAEVSELANTAVAQIAGVDSAALEGTAGDEDGDFEPAPHRASPPPHHTPRIPASAGGKGPPLESINRILHLEVPVIVQLAQRNMPLSEILNLTSGSIIEFDKAADSELDLMINNKCIGQGRAVKVNENFGLRVNTIGTLQERIKALGGD